MQLTLGRSSAHYRLYGRVHRWTLLTWAQVFALGFMLSAIAWFVFRLSTTDMAFVWSTTLDIEPQTLAAMYGDAAVEFFRLKRELDSQMLLRDEFLERTFPALLESGGLDDQD